MIFGGRPEPGQVFTPRSSDVNADMYVARVSLEKKLNRAINGSQHVLICGDSGNGKTWLYKEYFTKHNVAYRTVDLSIAITEGLDQALLKSLPFEQWEEVKKIERQSLQANLVVAKPAEQRTIEFQKKQSDSLELVLQSLSQERGKRRFLVFDNFEQVSRVDNLVQQIASLIIRLDNEHFSAFGVRFLFVGVVSDMKEIIARHDFAGTIANRLTEIPEVERLTPFEAEDLIVRGLEEKLRISFDMPLEEIVRQIQFQTDRNAQQIHELGYQIACEAQENGWRLSPEGMKRAEQDWVDTSLGQFTAQIEGRMNKRDTKIQRKNQVLFCLGANETNSIRATQIEEMIRKFFPDKVSAGQLGVDQILSGLAEGDNPILIRNPNDPSYRLANPKFRLALRARMKELTPKKAPTVDELMSLLLDMVENNETEDHTLNF
ncbi:AAA family ATPase [Shimia sp. R10_1]|uniref:AAA family ATPase n=1 Tax=Shimia sp. R10_1 TaxID=2821095 RepID=UPI001ADCA0D8|nr:AAA family ATPase [Shimia sp. R10_1]MBO9475063.1 AAA family ATPase [Shimia sp. R10_1]